MSIEPYALSLEHHPLKTSVADAVVPDADAPLSVDDSMPGQAAVLGQEMECVTDQACMPGQAREPRHLAVCSDAAPRDSRDHGMDTAVCV